MRSDGSEIPHISRPLVGGFQKFLGRFLRGKFHSVSLNRQALENVQLGPSDSLVIFGNHASWYDPLTAMLLAQRVFGDFRMYAPIDAEALQKYQMFAKMGFYPVEQSNLRGAVKFIRTSSEILRTPGASIWMTPEGRFVDPRHTTAEFMPGLSHLAAKLARERAEAASDQLPRVWFIPLAIEYVFWEESKPELLTWLGTPIDVANCPASFEKKASNERNMSLGPEAVSDKQRWNAILFQSLRNAQQELAQASIARDSTQFEILLGGKSGSFFIYDWWRRASGWITGRKVDVSHSDKLNVP